tara:strand:+ start:1343 stop:2248 length:906 start_codon:yes stop_codon:yes gene_type:complete
MFNNICIIGCGLIGSSILRAIKTKKISKKITICDKSRDVLSYLKKENLAELITDNPKDAVKDSDLIIISTPLSSYKEILLIIKDSLKNDTILTDTGSVKKEINKVVENLNLKNISWIASHPIAGTEESGPESGYAELFNNRWCIISASNNVKKEHIDKIKNFWEKLGSKVKQMKVDEHDHILSLTSHLPHAVAYNLVKTAVEDNAKFKNEIIKYSAGGLRDFTRIAASDPVMWRDIFIDNSKDVLDVLNKFSENIQDFKKALSEKNGDKLLKIFLSTKNIRKEIIKAGQDVESPDFGRKKN